MLPSPTISFAPRPDYRRAAAASILRQREQLALLGPDMVFEQRTEIANLVVGAGLNRRRLPPQLAMVMQQHVDQ